MSAHTVVNSMSGRPENNVAGRISNFWTCQEMLTGWCLWQVWAHIACLNNQMAQHPKQFRYNMEHYMCDLCQQELREQAAHVASRSEQASPRDGLGLPGRKSGLQSAFAAEVRMCPSSKSGHQVLLIASLSLIMLCAHC